jgi:hypothetical protein
VSCREFSTATRNYAKKQINWYRKDKEFLFLKIDRSSYFSASSSSSPVFLKSLLHTTYQSVASELLSYLSLSRLEYEELLKKQLYRSNLYQRHLKKGKVEEGYVCEDNLEFQIIKELLENELIVLESVLNKKGKKQPQKRKADEIISDVMPKEEEIKEPEHCCQETSAGSSLTIDQELVNSLVIKRSNNKRLKNKKIKSKDEQIIVQEPEEVQKDQHAADFPTFRLSALSKSFCFFTFFLNLCSFPHFSSYCFFSFYSFTDNDIRFNENKYMKYFASKFQQSSYSLERFQNILEEADELREELWKKKPNEMKLFGEKLLKNKIGILLSAKAYE